jgi:thiamine pyrophosphate-dependent acetolactate synthase large subunit-like protein
MSPIHPDELGWSLEQELDPDAIVVSENLSGSNQFLSTGFRENEKMWLMASGFGLGWGVGAATGAKLGQPERQVVCNIGDGSVMYSAAGFWSQARYGVPVLTVVCNNLNYQTVRNGYYRYNGKMRQANRYTGLYLGDPEIDFVKLAQSQGVEGALVENSGDLRPALRRGIEATRAGSPFLVDVRVRRIGGGADSVWHQAFNLAELRMRQV